MKTAVVISGQIRDAKQCFNSLHGEILLPYNADVFIDTWIPTNSIVDHRGDLIPNDMSIDEIIFNYKPKMINVEDFNSPFMKYIKDTAPKKTSSYDGSLAWETKVENVFYMYYKVWRANSLKSYYEKLNGFKYDCVIRMRFDLEFGSFPIIVPKKNEIYIPEGSNHRGGINDLMALGDSDTMDKHANLFCSLNQYMNMDIGLHPESLMRSHLEQLNLDIKRFQITYKLRGNNV
ncbi:hypothetical protein UFOVP49_155 [uncultured Caudovirales phage]|uniref:Uncharacterized protein n=1 Tax=uncultured Caudovirales phage TaxID=2100421 RepID=A0A6J5KTT4_9CAUD|nr:hypothetical protein UFOVP49_155 [uncultured Caudovirales phage]